MAGRIPQSFIDDLIGRADIVDVIQARVPLKKAGREYKACCPFHDEKTPSFTVSPQKQFYHCFGCGAHGTVLGFLMDYEQLEFVDAVEELAARYGLQVPREGGGPEPDEGARERTERALKMLEAACGLYRRWLKEHPQSQAAKDYLKGRGMSGRTAAAFELGFAPPGWDNLLSELGGSATERESLAVAGLLSDGDDGRRQYDRFRNRIMFPIRDRRGRVVAFGARTLGDDTPKYLNSPETPVFHKGRELYALDRMARRRHRPDSVVVVEGYMDVVMLAESGVDYAVAALGTAATPEQIERLLRAHPDVVFCFDGDAAGGRAAWRALENALPFMKDGRSARFAFLPQGEDPDSFVGRHGREAFESLLESAPTLTGYLFDTLRARNDTRTPEGQARLTEEARPLIERLPEGTLRTLAAQRLSQLIGLSLDRTEGELGLRQAPAPREAPPEAGAGTTGRSVTTPARRAVSLLLHRPALAATAGDVTDLPLLGTPGAALVAELVEFLKPRPHMSTAGLVEHFREHPHGESLSRLAASKALTHLDGSDAAIDGEALESEFQDCLQQVRRDRQEIRYQELRQRMNEGAATEAEQREYAALAQSRKGRGG